MSGCLGKLNVEPGGWRHVYTVPAGKVATVNINLVNHHEEPHKYSIAIGGTDDSCYLEKLATIPAYGVLERTGIVMSPGEPLYVWSDGWAVIRVHGFEESI